MTSSLDEDPRWQLVQRIVASPGFVNSSRLSAFLLHVSKASLIGEGGNLNERTVGEAVFERSPGYDPRDDNIVRSHASRLRLRLQDYFREEGASETLRVSIPRGSYVPVFEPTELDPYTPVDGFPGSTIAPSQESSEALRTPSPRSTVKVMLICLAVASAASAGTALYLRHQSSLQETPSHKLWTQVFRNDKQTIIVPADSSLVIARLMVGHQIGLEEYAGGLYRRAADCDKPCDLGLVETIESLRYTSMSDLEFAVKVTHIPEAIPVRTEIRFARDLELKDLKESNLIMAGSQEADPWLAAISGQMNFVVHDDPSAGVLRVENRHPKTGEMAEYVYDPHEPQHRGFATIAFLPNLSNSGNLLVIQGFTLAGTQAAAEFITNRRDIDELFRTFDGNESKLPHFEILLSTMEINGMASSPVVLAWHVYR